MAYNPMAWMPKWVSDCARARLRIEALEERALLTIAGFEMNLYADEGGAPGALVSADTVEVGESFFVEITAEDRRDSADGLAGQSPGIRGLALDIAWDPTVFAAIGTFDVASGIVTDSFPLFREGELNNGAGRIDDLQGAMSLSLSTGELIGDEGPERFALLHFRAIDAVASSSLAMNLGLRQISMFPSVPFIQGSDFEFEAQTITVVDPVETLPAPQTETQINIYQGGSTPVDVESLNANEGFLVEIILAPPIDAHEFDATDDSVAIVDAGQSANSANETAQLDVASLLPFAEGVVELDAGELMVTQLAVDMDGVAVDLPLAVGPLQEALFDVRTTRQIGLSYWPLQPSAADAAMATAASEEFDDAEGVDLDRALLQALASGLTHLGVEEEVADPLNFVQIPSDR